MNKSKNMKNSLKPISDKIANHNRAYDIDEDEENQNYNNSPKLEEKIIDDIIDPRKSAISEQIFNAKTNNLKESLISPSYQNINKKLNLNSSIKYFPIKLVICKIHKKKYLKITPNNYEIICEQCIEEGKSSQLEIIDLSDEEENIYNCFKHKEASGSFYCEDCKEFICKICFAEEHRNHKSHLPEIINQEFVKNIKESIDFSSELIPVLNESVNDIKKIYENMKKQKSDTMIIPQNTLKVISNNNTNQIDFLMDKTIKTFLGIDNEVQDNCITFSMLKDRTKKYLDIINDLNKEMDNIKQNKDNFDLCKFHKEKFNLLNEIIDYIISSFNFLNIRLTNTNNKYEENIENIENSLNLMEKEISNYEKSCISSISTGRENRCIILRRYVHFSHNEIKYFKNTIIGFASNNNVFLCGLSLCGLYVKKKKNTPQTDDGDENKISEEDNNINEDMKKKISIQITISTMSNQNEGEQLFNQKCELGGVKGSEEPTVIINFEKGINILKEKLYVIKIENLSDNNYIDIWAGAVGKLKNKNIQVIRCHNTGIQFLFKQAEGIQTDFDEFENGIIEGILYSNNK